MDDSNEQRSVGSAPMEVMDRERLFSPGDPHPHLVMTSAELRRALRVWLGAAVMPRRLWEPFEQQLKAELDPRRPTRRGRDELVDPRDILADYLVSRFEKAKWRPTREEPSHAFNPSPWLREGAEIPVPAEPPQNASSG